jgi:hypothetical protein
MLGLALNQTKSVVIHRDFLPSNTDPSDVAARVGSGMRSGVRSVIEACVTLVDGVRIFEADPGALEKFRQALADQNVLPRRSARLGNVEKGKFSMLKKIGENAGLLLDDQIFGFLEAGYSVLYHVVRLYEELPGDHQARLAELAKRFSPQGGLTRDFLIEQIDLATKPANDNEPDAPLPWADETTKPAFELVLMTPSNGHMRRLREDYVGRLPLWGRIYDRVSTDAIGVVVARVSDLPIIERKLLPGCGFAGIAQVFLLHEPLSSDVTQAEVVVLARRQPSTQDESPQLQWMPKGQAVDLTALSTVFAPGAQQKLHLFATSASDGWQSIVGEANWSDADV